MESNEKDVKIKELTDKVEFLSSIIIKAHKYAKNDPEIALTQARKSAEAICRNIFSAEIGEPGKIMLDELIKKLAERKILPTKILLPLGTIQAYGNYGTHAQSATETIDFNYITPCLSALAQVSSWYFTEYLKTNIPADLAAQEGVKEGAPGGEGGAAPVSPGASAATTDSSGPGTPPTKKKSLLWVVVVMVVAVVAAGVFFMTREGAPAPSDVATAPDTLRASTSQSPGEHVRDTTAGSAVKEEKREETAAAAEKVSEQASQAGGKSAVSPPRKESVPRTSEVKTAAQTPQVTPPPAAPATPDVDPTVLKEVPAEYPASMAGSHVEGDVRVRVLVDATGKPTEARILSYDDERFQVPATAAAMHYKFSPGLAGGKPVPAWITVKIHFQEK